MTIPEQSLSPGVYNPPNRPSLRESSSGPALSPGIILQTGRLSGNHPPDRPSLRESTILRTGPGIYNPPGWASLRESIVFWTGSLSGNIIILRTGPSPGIPNVTQTIRALGSGGARNYWVTPSASPGESKLHHTGSSRRSQVHRIGLCPKLLLDHTKYVPLPETFIYVGVTETQVLHMEA